MLFDIQEFFAEMATHENLEKRNVMAMYKTYFPEELRKSDLREQVWYQEYTTNFKTIPYAVPFASQQDFDWDLLMQLAAGSFSSETQIISNPESSLPELYISVENGGHVVSKPVSSLFGYQIFRLFNIYCEENMNLQNHIYSDEGARKEIFAQRDYKIRQWNYRLKFALKNEQELQAILHG